MRRFSSILALLALPLTSAHAGIDEAINSATAPIASLIGQIVFFKIPIFGAQLPLVVLWLVAGAVFACALLSITQAYRIAVVSVVAPFEYSYLLWVSLLGYLMFGDIPGTRTVIGGSLVVLAGLYIIYRERRRS